MCVCVRVCKRTKCVMHLLCIIYSCTVKKMLNALAIRNREIGMSRQLICIKNLKKLGDVVRISSRGRNGYECGVRNVYR